MGGLKDREHMRRWDKLDLGFWFCQSPSIRKIGFAWHGFYHCSGSNSVQITFSATYSVVECITELK